MLKTSNLVSDNFTVKVSVPGKSMISGEYSILDGSRALAFALDKRLNCFVSKNDCINIQSNYESFDESYNHWNGIFLKGDKFDILRSAVRKSLEKNDLNNVKIKIESDIDPKHGIGSSSALIFAIVASIRIFNERLNKYFNGIRSTSLESYLKDGLIGFGWQKENQKRASGYDFLTQAVGGFVIIDSDSNKNPDNWIYSYDKINNNQEKNKHIRLYVGGYGSPTATTTNKTYSQLTSSIKLNDLKRANNAITDLVEAFIMNGNCGINNLLSNIKDPFEEHYEIMSKTDGRLPDDWVDCIKKIDGYRTFFNFKSTGAGGEDAILFIGDFSALSNFETILKKINLHRLDSPIGCQGIYTEILDRTKNESKS